MADENLKFDKNGREFSETVRNWLRASSPFPTVFSVDLHYIHVKTRACLGKG